MTNEEAKVKTFDVLHFVADNAGLSTFEAIEKAYNMGVSEQEPCDKYIKEIDHLRKYIYKLETQIVEQKPCEDAISRQAAIDAMYSLCGDGTLKENEWRDNPHIDSIIDALNELQSVSVVEKTGRWIEDVDESREWDRVRFYCSRCEDWNTYGKTKYCPGCGAKMEVEE